MSTEAETPATTSIEEVCLTPNCGKKASLHCPVCEKLNLPVANFCSQECFKSYWPIHKIKHLTKEERQTSNDAFKRIKFTGKLRPSKVTPRRAPPSGVTLPDYALDGFPHSERAADKRKMPIPIHTKEEIEIMRELSIKGREVLDIAGRAAKVGVTTEEIDIIVHNACAERGCYPSPLNYLGFPKACCTSINEVICHGIPDLRPLEDGDIVNIDVSLYWKGFHCDLNETYLVGNVNESGKKLVRVTWECLEKAMAIIKPGVMYRELGDIIQKHAHANGFSVVKNYCGHGVGKLFHGPPTIPHYARNKAVGAMKAGHIFTIEPMINEGTWEDELWPDEWTAVTADGKRSAQFEHTILVTDTGYEVLSARRDGSKYDFLE
ncbi:methionine aminopeptidase 1 [Heterostelium album PN500]|uniref:Methionine aminopeptidase n=1 Tax=Heterostelium pallidum (strain ATCC 26659 / Pp 5 / PN500) TaxID=670386 RepID=D3AZS9_HETP5|nr:methionine aminopeptidase 1 [Heterostelium album PN500]EFA84553.1 methionine aminopeptidase 1 [Heterostelium album PN500]|eukprot:XP_020436666.1 methionine aminopeptidase 1 [Heterostelium album PN500]